MWDRAYAWEVSCWKLYEAIHLTLNYILIDFNAKGGWVVTLTVCLHHISTECKSPFIPMYSVNMGFHLSALLRRAGIVRLKSKLTSAVLPASSYNGWVRPNILYILLIILKFTYNRCNKVKIYKGVFIDYIFIINLVKVLATVQEPLFKISVYGKPTCFALLDEER